MSELTKYYQEFKHILSGCDTIKDAEIMGKMYIQQNPDSKEIIDSLILGTIFHDKYDMNIKRNFLNDIINSESKDEAYEIIDRIQNDNKDLIFKMSMIRLANSKNYFSNTPNENIEDNMITKKCPHRNCNKVTKLNKNTTYVICGYCDSKKGYDWNGCGNDWCFQCGKLLCKNWQKDKLFVEHHRIHNEECCKNHAEKYNYQYPYDYCRCNTQHLIKNYNFDFDFDFI